MNAFSKLLAGALALTGVAAAAPALGAGAGPGVIDHDWSFEGPFGTFDRAELQRGWQVYSQVCASCHAMHLVRFRNLGDKGGPEFPKEQVVAMAEAFSSPVRTVVNGEIAELPPKDTDAIVGPYSLKTADGRWVYDEEAWAEANQPPDLSLITKARVGYHGIFKQIAEGSGGPEYVYSLMLGYTDEPPEGFDVGDLSYNKYFPGHRIAMGQPLWGDDVEYQDGTEATIEQQAHDLVAFLAWAAEPTMENRKEAGIRNILLLSIFAVLVWYCNKKLWKPIKDNA